MNSVFLKTFVCLANVKTFKGTADRLNTSQPVISTRIAALEKYLGVSLYQGSGKTFRLTPVGEKLLRKCESVVLMCDEILLEAKTVDRPNQVLKVGVPEIVALTWFPEFSRRINSLYPANSLEFYTGKLGDILTKIHNDELDIAFIVDYIADPVFQSEYICSFKMEWFANPSYSRVVTA